MSKTVSLGDVCEVLGGATPSKRNKAYFEGSIPWATIRDMRGDMIETTECLITEQALASCPSSLIPAGKVVVATRVGLGKVCRVRQPTAINQDIRGLVPKNPNTLDDQYLFYCMKAKSQAIVAAGTGATVQGVRLDFIKGLEIPLPSLDEQRRIVKVLDEAQQLITEGRASATKIEAACGELTRSALRTQLASFPSRTRVESLASLIDSGVIYLNRGKVISKRDLNASPGDYPVYSSASANNGQFGRYGEFMFDEEAITWSIDGGGTFFHRPRHRFSVTNVGGILRIADLGTLNYRYLYLVLNEHQQTINFDWVRKAHPSVIRGLYNHIPIPPLETQDQIVARIDEIQASVQNLSDTATGRRHLFARLQSSSLESLIEAV